MKSKQKALHSAQVDQGLYSLQSSDCHIGVCGIPHCEIGAWAGCEYGGELGMRPADHTKGLRSKQWGQRLTDGPGSAKQSDRRATVNGMHITNIVL